MAYPYTYNFKHLDNLDLEDLMKQSKDLTKFNSEWSEESKRVYPLVYKHRVKKLEYIKNLINSQIVTVYSFFNDGDHIGELEVPSDSTHQEIYELGMEHFFGEAITQSDVLLDFEVFEE